MSAGMCDVLELAFGAHGPRATPSRDTGVPGGTPRTALVTGDGRVSGHVLILSAVTAAADLDVRVLFYTHTPIQALPGPLQEAMSRLGPDRLKKIRFIYPGCVEDLLQEVASLHQMASAPSPPPSLILVDGLEWYLQGREEESAAARLAALLCDTAAFLTRDLDRRGEGRGPCRLIVSFHPDRDGRGPGEAVLSVLDRYFQVKCGLDEAGAEGSRREWHVCMSGPSSSESDVGKRWHLVVEDNGAMEFREIANRATESCEKYDKS